MVLGYGRTHPEGQKDEGDEGRDEWSWSRLRGISMRKKMNNNQVQIKNITRMDMVREERKREALRDLDDENDDN